MPDLWQECICDKKLMCSREDRLDLEQELEVLRNLEEPLDQGFETGGSDDQMWMWADSMGCVDELPDSFMLKLGALIGKAGLPFWSFSYSNCASRLIVGESGGGRFRIYPDGSVVFPEEVWDKAQVTQKRYEQVCDALDAMVANNPADKEHMAYHEWKALQKAKALLAEIGYYQEEKHGDGLLPETGTAIPADS